MTNSVASHESSGSRRPLPLVAISTTYGAGGDVVGRKVADTLGVPYLGHTFTSEQMEEAHRRRNPSEAYLQHRVRGDLALDDEVAASAVVEFGSRALFEQSDDEVRTLLTKGGVVVGRAGVYVLRDAPGVLRVLLDGRRHKRIMAGAALEGVDIATAERRQAAHDASRVMIARGQYGADPNELRQYAMVLDTTVIGFDTAADLVVTAARALHASDASPQPGTD